MRISSYVCGALGSNCYIIQDEGTGKAVIVDAGEFIPEIKEHIDRIGKENIVALLLTHCHFDHTMGASELREYTGTPLMIHAHEGDWVDDPKKNGIRYFMGASGVRFPKPDKVFRDGDIIEAGDLAIKVMHTPGHSPGSSCFAVENVLFSGDTLFLTSIGRTDLPGGSHTQISSSLQKLAALDGSIKVYPGHGEPTTIAFEREHNPYME